MPLTRGDVSSAISAVIQPPMELPMTVTSCRSSWPSSALYSAARPPMEFSASGRGVAGEAGVGRHQHAHVVGSGELLCEPGHRLRARPAVQEQERLPGPVVGDGHPDRADAGQVHGVQGGVHGSPWSLLDEVGQVPGEVGGLAGRVGEVCGAPGGIMTRVPAGAS
jgi:hypothetical protein